MALPGTTLCGARSHVTILSGVLGSMPAIIVRSPISPSGGLTRSRGRRLPREFRGTSRSRQRRSARRRVENLRRAPGFFGVLIALDEGEQKRHCKEDQPAHGGTNARAISATLVAATEPVPAIAPVNARNRARPIAGARIAVGCA